MNKIRCYYSFLRALGFLLALLIGNSKADIDNCPFENTVNISDIAPLPNGSYLYRGELIPLEFTGWYDYQLYFDERVEVQRHRRGCVCRNKACFQFCCHPKRGTKTRLERSCSNNLTEDIEYDPYLNVTLNDGSRASLHALDDFVVQEFLPCAEGGFLVPKYDPKDSWQLLENGSLYREYDKVLLSKLEYCFHPFETGPNEIGLYPVYCMKPKDDPLNLFTNFIGMIISIPFMIATILVYALIRELRNLHGKCLISYLIALASAMIILNLNTLLSYAEVNVSSTMCSVFGFACYYAFLAAFFWLSAISFDLWYNFRGTNSRVSRIVQQRRFIIYSIFAWSVPAIFTGVTLAIQLSDIDAFWKSGIGVEYCWINIDEWITVLYYYGPVLLIIIFNCVMFTLTSLKIYRVQKELSRIVSRDEGARHLSSEKDNFGLFLRLFMIMGVIWLFEIISYFVGRNNVWSTVLYGTDFLNSIHGIIIFFLFVWKRKVKELVKKRLCHKGNTDSESDDSAQSDCDPGDMCMRNYNKDGTLQFLQ